MKPGAPQPVDPNHWSAYAATPPPSSDTEPGVPEAMALARAQVAAVAPWQTRQKVKRTCYGRLDSCLPTAVASWNCANGNRLALCQECLDAWFDNADDDPFLEPESWGWL